MEDGKGVMGCAFWGGGEGGGGGGTGATSMFAWRSWDDGVAIAWRGASFQSHNSCIVDVCWLRCEWMRHSIRFQSGRL